MLRVFSIAGFLFILAGCAPLVTFYQPGVSAARLETDSVQCEVSALKQVPVANKTVQDPPDFIPAETICDSDGNCKTFPAEFVPGQIRTVDVNAKLRARVTQQCMMARGYRLERIPRCPVGLRAAGQVSPLPPLDQNSCATQTRDGKILIVQQE